MIKITGTQGALLGGLVLALAISAGANRFGIQDGPTAPPEVPSSPTPGWDLVYARPFTTDQPFVHWWRKERPLVDAGWLLVLSADPSVLAPRETAEPVLFVGSQTAERFNKGHEDGALIAIVPSSLTPDGQLDLKLEEAPIWFGEPALPEQVDALAVKQARELAERSGIRPFTADQVSLAIGASGEVLQLQDRTSLEHEAARLVLRFAPREESFARGRLIDQR